MASTRTGVYLEDFLDDCSSLPHELQRLLSTMRELDERSHALQVNIREQVQECLEIPSLQQLQNAGAPQERTLKVEKLRKEIASKQEKTIGLCTEKVLLAQQAYDLLDGHEKRLAEDLIQFEQELKQEGKLHPGELQPITPVGERRKVSNSYLTPPVTGRQTETKRTEGKYDTLRDGAREGIRPERDSLREGWRERERVVERVKERVGEKMVERDEEPMTGREKERDIGLMPPPPSQRKRSFQSGPALAGDNATVNEPTYCICGQVSFGDMVKCDNPNCKGGEWFHYSCVGLGAESRGVKVSKWFCPSCRSQQRRRVGDSVTTS